MTGSGRDGRRASALPGPARALEALLPQAAAHPGTPGAWDGLPAPRPPPRTGAHLGDLARGGRPARGPRHPRRSLSPQPPLILSPLADDSRMRGPLPSPVPSELGSPGAPSVCRPGAVTLPKRRLLCDTDCVTESPCPPGWAEGAPLLPLEKVSGTWAGASACPACPLPPAPAALASIPPWTAASF